ncbi:hypothetical protein X943_001040 [Babesia divergens]|uniref:Uncharacterized protein n=1 Tax=Babesia divergens TaxID=32595 RepID=A0AAD9LKE0_BABDI|nr:hypothetical protein X943_001040 [Babesia divergens]
MVASTVLPILYEFLVSESRYEVRGSEYRARLKAIFNELMCAQLEFPMCNVSAVRQASFKTLEELVNCVGFADCDDVNTFKLDACPGIRQYVYPAIPDFTQIDADFVKSWQYFFGFIDTRDRASASARNRRPKPSSALPEPSLGGEDDSDESSSESDSTICRDTIKAVITADDILNPRQRPENLDSMLSVPPSTVPSTPPNQVGSIATENSTYMHRKVPIYMDSTYKIDKGAVVFGVMNDAQLSYEWSCNTSYSAYAESLKNSVAGTDFVSDGDVSFVEAAIDEDDSGYDSNSSGSDDEATDQFDPNSIFGNYYCPLPRGHKAKLQGIKMDERMGTVEVSSINYTTFTPQAMEVTSMMYVGSDGTPHVSCVGTLAARSPEKPYSNKVKYHNRQSNIQHRLESAISGIFAIKNAIGVHCDSCSGWSLNNGCSIIFCEACEYRLLHVFDPIVLNRLFELRRDLRSELYPAIGYKSLDLGVENSFKDKSGSKYVTIPALCEIGGIYPKASLHDGRYQPNSLNIPMSAAVDLSSIVYTNAELRPYSECRSTILEICRQRRQQRLRAFNDYLEGLLKLYHTSISHESYPLIVNEFDQVFKHALLPIPSAGFDRKRQYFDEVTSSVLCKLPLDIDMLRKVFYRRGVYTWRSDASSSIMPLADEECHDVRGKVQPPIYQWPEVALKNYIRKAPTENKACISVTGKSQSSSLKPCAFLDFVNRTGTLDDIPREYVDHLHQTGRLEVGFPTSLEMHLLCIPDSVLDPSMYSRCGMAFLFSLPSTIQRLCALSTFLRVSGTSHDNPKRRSKDTVVNKTV